MSDTKWLDFDGNELKVGDEVEIVKNGPFHTIGEKTTIHNLYHWYPGNEGTHLIYAPQGSPAINSKKGGIPCCCVRLVRPKFRVGDVVRHKRYGYLMAIVRICRDGEKISSYIDKDYFLDSKDYVFIGHVDIPTPDPNPWPEMYYESNGKAHRVILLDDKDVQIGCQNMTLKQVKELYKIFREILDWKKIEDAK